MLIEAYVTSPVQALAAEDEGAGRIELCGPGEGGLTPTLAAMRQTLDLVRVPVHVMIRPREGDFVYDDAEFAQMRQGVLDAKAARVAGVVFGMLNTDGTFDALRMRELVALARPLRVGVHRAFDRTADPEAALDTLLELGIHVVLTSGHAPTALEGAATLQHLVARAENRLTILAGGSVRAENVRALLDASGVSQIHARATAPGIIAGIVAALGDNPR